MLVKPLNASRLGGEVASRPCRLAAPLRVGEVREDGLAPTPSFLAAFVVAVIRWPAEVTHDLGFDTRSAPAAVGLRRGETDVIGVAIHGPARRVETAGRERPQYPPSISQASDRLTGNPEQTPTENYLISCPGFRRRQWLPYLPSPGGRQPGTTRTASWC